MSEETLFHEALGKPPGERAAFLDRACSGDRELRAAVQALLSAHEASGPFLDPPADAEVDADSQSPPTSTTVEYRGRPEPNVLIAGRYILQEKIGDGGMGEVWVARQSEPVRRKVALKLIKPGMNSGAVLQRFEQERQALAMMDHPNIARVLDAGMTPNGQPFFVMELVNGLPLNRFCDELKLTPRERMELFVPICQAVQHAHQKGIVHRDLKPANILITMIDAKPVPKIIDFGVAKATAGKLTDESISTQFGAVVGTLEYMSPEQAGYSSEDIDTRADIYSLGVILYEMLTGLRPLDAARLRKAAMTELIRIIREEEPSKPSTQLSAEGALPSLAALRQTDPRRLMALLRGDLDWVVMKCLEKHRERRYETANALARDVRRYLDGDAVEARPPSLGYRMGKFFRRNRGPVLAAGFVLLALVAGIIGTSLGLIRAEHEKESAIKAKYAEAARAEGERLAKLDAEAKRRDAETNLGYARKANEILRSVFWNLDPQREYATVAELRDALKANLGRAVGELEGTAIGDPLAVAEMQDTLAASLLSLGAAEQAIPLFLKARETRKARLGPDHRLTLTSMSGLSVAYRAADRLDLALPLCLETLKLQKARLGPEDSDTLASMVNLASIYYTAGETELALPLFEETLRLRKARLGPEHLDTLRSMDFLANEYRFAGKLDLALPLCMETLRLRKARLGPDHLDTLASMNNLAAAYRAAGKLDLALPLFEEAFKLEMARLGPDQTATLTIMNNLAYQAAGKLDLALPLCLEAFKLAKARLGPEHSDRLAAMDVLASAYQAAGKLDLALPLSEEAFKLHKAKLGPDHPLTLMSMLGLAAAYQVTGKRDLALPLFEEALRLRKAKLGPDHPQTCATITVFALASEVAGKRDLSLFEEALELGKAEFGPDHPQTLVAMNRLAAAYRAAGKLDLALPLFEKMLKLHKARLGPNHPLTLQSMYDLALGYEEVGKPDEAARVRKELGGRDLLTPTCSNLRSRI